MFLEAPPWSPRFVLAHVNNLPMGSAFVAENRGGQQFRGWDQDRYMQAALIDSQRVANYLFIMANTDPKKSKPKPPEPYPVPDELDRKQLDKPGSFGFISKDLLAKAKKRKGAV